MGFFSALSGKDAERAMSRLTAAQNRWHDSARNAVNDTYGNGLASLNRGVGQAIGTAQNYNQEALSYLGQGTNAAARALSAGRDAGLGYYDRAVGAMSPYTTAGAGALSMYSNALGLNGASGNAAATRAFQAGPGYDWQTSQATEAARRLMAAGGMGSGGNALAGGIKLANNLANQAYGGWLDRLSGLGQQGQAAAGVSAGLMGQQGQMAYGAGQGLGNLYNGWGNAAAGLQTGLGSQIAGLQSGLGQAENANWMGRGNTLAGLAMQHSNTIADNYKSAAQAHAAGAQNIAGLGMGLLNTGVKLFTGGL